MSNLVEYPTSKYSNKQSHLPCSWIPLGLSPPQTPASALVKHQILSICDTWLQTFARMVPETLVIQLEWILENLVFKSKCCSQSKMFQKVPFVFKAVYVTVFLNLFFFFLVMLISGKDAITLILLVFNTSLSSFWIRMCLRIREPLECRDHALFASWLQCLTQCMGNKQCSPNTYWINK